MYSFSGKKILITGGGSGIGRGLCVFFAKYGADLAILDLNRPAAEKTKQLVDQHGNHSIVLECDVRNKKQIEVSLSKLHTTFKRLDIAVNCAGIASNRPAEKAGLEWKSVLDVNLNGLFYSCQCEFNLMRPKKKGKIINIASMSSIRVPKPQKQAAYNTSKAGVAHLTRSLAVEWASDGITVNAISPGIVQTDMIKTSELKLFVNQWIQQIPLQRLATIDDMLGPIGFLASEHSAYMTGHNLIVDGGQSL